ncbi:nucleoside recognition protein [Salsuginibacillus halophilus]|uniref:Nucleoside recognition protein n=1 Tax=Salsuginibacillus halophilus TaxID=517424 RepID=A0A2P8H947_9BACI|nr:nucleoside recognition domain-containing protein [Salsuginibacillus halophilus]PSL42755.1 nucleoside recognition protein [Salsuginibacillus halophilus]
MQTLKQGLLVGLKTTWMLAKIIFPITLIVTVLGYTPALDWLAEQLAPLMSWIGLPGEAAIPLVLGNVLNLYAAIGAILSLDLTIKEVFILAVMLSFSHNLFVESAIAVKLGLRISVVLAVRIGLAVFSAFMIHWFWQGGSEPAEYGLAAGAQQPEVSGWGGVVLEGLTSAAVGVFQIGLVVIPIMIFIQVMKDMNWLDRFSNGMAPLTRVLGIEKNTSTTLASGLLFGLAFGAGVMIQEAKEKNVKKKDLYLVFIFLVACHAVIEDTLIFIPLGIPVLPLLIIRLVTAVLLTMLIAYIWNRLEKDEASNTEQEATYGY